MVVVPSTRAESALSVDASAERRAAIGLTRVTPWPAALAAFPEPDEPQAATDVTAVATAAQSVMRRVVVLFMRPPRRLL
ncbi:hypothetical protein GCM10010510_08140 [Streptomyces anandii JCM 4720]|nr:hypothetical protein GCM10010510_08140 [Streptomyces anandii JCM 4720]